MLSFHFRLQPRRIHGRFNLRLPHRLRPVLDGTTRLLHDDLFVLLKGYRVGIVLHETGPLQVEGFPLEESLKWPEEREHLVDGRLVERVLHGDEHLGSVDLMDELGVPYLVLGQCLPSLSAHFLNFNQRK